MDAVALFETHHAHRYLTTLCAHFAHTVTVTVTEETGQVDFPFGRCVLTVDPERLELVASASNLRDLDKVEQIVTRHLERFAFRENPTLTWRPSVPPATPAPSVPSNEDQ